MAVKSIQIQLSESIQLQYKDSIVKKVDKDNFVDIYIPSVHSSKATHLYFNTAKGQIKLGFYIRDIEFINKVVSQSSKNIESYSQGLRLKSNPPFETVEQAIIAAKKLLDAIDLNVTIPEKVAKSTRQKEKVKVSGKPVQKKPKKQDLASEPKESIYENIPFNTSSANKNKKNWLGQLLDFISKLIKK